MRDAGRRTRESRNLGRLLARRPRRVAAHQAPARARGAPVNGKREAAFTTVGCSPRKRHGALIWPDATVIGSSIYLIHAAMARRAGRAMT
jgi:hypothetical protein